MTAGDDTFVFATAGQGGHRVFDFGNATDNNDGFEIGASGFGRGLVCWGRRGA